jgi:hypothetical protein
MFQVDFCADSIRPKALFVNPGTGQRKRVDTSNRGGKNIFYLRVFIADQELFSSQ